MRYEKETVSVRPLQVFPLRSSPMPSTSKGDQSPALHRMSEAR